MLQTCFHPQHLALGARMAAFAGFDMPLHYGSQLIEHEAVRTKVGMFDVSHMMITDLRGMDAKRFLQKLIANDVAKLDKIGPGKALYSPMLNSTGGVIDDLIVYLMPEGYRLVTNAGTRVRVNAWLTEQASPYAVSLQERDDFAMLAVQGPEAIATVARIRPLWKNALTHLGVFQAFESEGFFVARTGYTGEDGLEIMIPKAEASTFWAALLQAGVQPCGLAARDTLRLEAGMNLYGAEMDEALNPLAAGLAWCIDLKDLSRDFIGRAMVEVTQQEGHQKQVGLILLGKGVLRGHQVFRTLSGQIGEVTSGTFSPTLKQSIAIARVPAETGDMGTVEIRGNAEPVRVVALPFVRKGKILI